MAEWLEEWLDNHSQEDKADSPSVDRVLSSTAVRTRETLQLMQGIWSPRIEPQIEWHDDLYLAEPRVIWDAYRKATREHPNEGSLLVLGHNPGMEILISGLAGKDLHVPTAAIAIFQSQSGSPIGELVPEIESNRWELLAFQTPRSLSA
jgi:phosphohistidine phosphatase